MASSIPKSTNGNVRLEVGVELKRVQRGAHYDGPGSTVSISGGRVHEVYEFNERKHVTVVFPTTRANIFGVQDLKLVLAQGKVAKVTPGPLNYSFEGKDSKFIYYAKTLGLEAQAQ